MIPLKFTERLINKRLNVVNKYKFVRSHIKKISKSEAFKTQISVFAKCISVKRDFSSAESVGVEKHSQQKLLKVAVLGRTNVGKSTLINEILQLNVCDVSKKIHTTLFPVRASFISGNTQIIFIDTPGVISQKMASRLVVKKEVFKLDDTLNKADVVAVMEEANYFKVSMAFDQTLLNYMEKLPEEKPMILIINKVDLLKDKFFLLKVSDWALSLQQKKSAETKRIIFQRIFFISALHSDGVKDISSYLLEEAREGKWILDENLVCDLPLDKLIINLLRAEMLNLLPQEIPYKLDYKINILEVNNLGEIICEAYVICPKQIFFNKIVIRNKKSLKTIAEKLESNLYNIIGKTVRLSIVVKTKNEMKLLNKNIQKKTNIN